VYEPFVGMSWSQVIWAVSFAQRVGGRVPKSSPPSDWTLRISDVPLWTVNALRVLDLEM
jgi:hypothetical protein